ncbi:MAG: hypothetical protein K1X89_19440 [Myxococcaceae bacterium]|nr:hypothetical protein [Myxococcaceae bacterium]
MTRLVGPPHRDVTRVPVLPPGWSFEDLALAFVTRVLAQPTAGSAVERAAAQVLSRRGPAWSRLRAATLLLDAATKGSAVSVLLDDVRLAVGTTESGADVERAAGGAVPWAQELAAVSPGEVVAWLEADLAVVGALGLAAVRGLTGSFALAHGPALRALGPLALAADHSPLPVEVGGLAGLAPPEPGLRFRELHQPRPSQRFCGYVTAGELLEAPPEASVAVVPLAALDERGALDVDGHPLDWRAVELACRRWADAGVQVAFELHVGAPGIGAGGFGGARERLEACSGAWVLGVRPFHLPRTAGPSWGQVRLSARETPPTLTLVRSARFDCPGTLEGEALQAAMVELGAKLSVRWPLAPARTALAIASGPPGAAVKGEALQVNDDCGVVEDGAAFAAVNLRTGTTLRLDARLAKSLAERPEALPTAERLAQVPAPQREKIRATLLAKGIVQEAQ